LCVHKIFEALSVTAVRIFLAKPCVDALIQTYLTAFYMFLPLVECRLTNLFFILIRKFSMLLRSGLLPGHSRTVT